GFSLLVLKVQRSIIKRKRRR
ncbi:DUF3270 domain-containing protein, partial [Streptococcus pneumoniae]